MYKYIFFSIIAVASAGATAPSTSSSAPATALDLRSIAKRLAVGDAVLPVMGASATVSSDTSAQLEALLRPITSCKFTWWTKV